MKLISFKVKHFRCLYETDWIPFSELSIFTGENDGGKSTTLYALEIFLDHRRSPTQDDYSYKLTDGGNERETEITCWARFELRDSERELLNATWEINEKILEVKRVFKNEETQSDYLFVAQAYDDDVFKQPLDNYTVPVLKEIAGRFEVSITGLSLKQDIVDAIKSWVQTQPKTSVEVKLPTGIIDCFPVMQIFSSESALDPENEIKRTLTTQFRELIKTDKYSGTILDIEKNVESDLNAGLSKLAPFVKQYSNDVETVAIRPNFNFASGLTTIELQLSRKDGRPIPLQQSGAGQRRRFSLAVYEWSQEIFKNRDDDSRQLIMAFDEPDTHLDYKSQRQIFDVIKRFAELPAIQVVVCTHSLNFIERVPINRIVHYRLEPSNRTTLLEILSVDNHETTELFMYEISKNMGLRNSVMLHERCFLVIEGSTESAALPVLFYKRFNMPLQSAGICLINGEGNYGARMLVKFLNIHKRQVIFLVDTDAISTDGLQKHFTPASFQIDGIDESNQVHYVGVKEFEDAFSDEHWARMAQANFPKKSGKAWEQVDFSVLRSNAKFSKALQALIKQEAELGYEPSKLDLGYDLAQCINSEEIPETIIRCLEQAYKIAN
jgi:putative ATP-dependent endonuclease of the OLD family